MNNNNKPVIKVKTKTNELSTSLNLKNRTIPNEDYINNYIKTNIKKDSDDIVRAEVNLITKNLNYIYNSEIRDIERFTNILNKNKFK